ncbi:hypothetical protein Y032_0272g934 [Ancylostoma ceylanicum]|uniref:Uncharacterized protein n=1 Tax=Ancylostoma ceylanicum TaxID=53326 RepID=A0A016S866_9BILA|nr:hypothetical protein Y032_0272g934 [Ancylostoma ceylanicum]
MISRVAVSEESSGGNTTQTEAPDTVTLEHFFSWNSGLTLARALQFGSRDVPQLFEKQVQTFAAAADHRPDHRTSSRSSLKNDMIPFVSLKRIERTGLPWHVRRKKKGLLAPTRTINGSQCDQVHIAALVR